MSSVNYNAASAFLDGTRKQSGGGGTGAVAHVAGIVSHLIEKHHDDERWMKKRLANEELYHDRREKEYARRRADRRDARAVSAAHQDAMANKRRTRQVQWRNEDADFEEKLDDRRHAAQLRRDTDRRQWNRDQLVQDHQVDAQGKGLIAQAAAHGKYLGQQGKAPNFSAPQPNPRSGNIPNPTAPSAPASAASAPAPSTAAPAPGAKAPTPSTPPMAPPAKPSTPTPSVKRVASNPVKNPTVPTPSAPASSTPAPNTSAPAAPAPASAPKSPGTPVPSAGPIPKDPTIPTPPAPATAAPQPPSPPAPRVSNIPRADAGISVPSGPARPASESPGGTRVWPPKDFNPRTDLSTRLHTAEPEEGAVKIGEPDKLRYSGPPVLRAMEALQKVTTKITGKPWQVPERSTPAEIEEKLGDQDFAKGTVLNRDTTTGRLYQANNRPGAVPVYPKPDPTHKVVPPFKPHPANREPKEMSPEAAQRIQQITAPVASVGEATQKFIRTGPGVQEPKTPADPRALPRVNAGIKLGDAQPTAYVNRQSNVPKAEKTGNTLEGVVLPKGSNVPPPPSTTPPARKSVPVPKVTVPENMRPIKDKAEKSTPKVVEPPKKINTAAAQAPEPLGSSWRAANRHGPLNNWSDINLGSSWRAAGAKMNRPIVDKSQGKPVSPTAPHPVWGNTLFTDRHALIGDDVALRPRPNTVAPSSGEKPSFTTTPRKSNVSPAAPEQKALNIDPGPKVPKAKKPRSPKKSAPKSDDNSLF